MVKKTTGIILLVIILIILFIMPVRNYISSLFNRDKYGLKEEQIIGTLSNYNPRVEETQRILRESGFDAGLIDGIMGWRTRKAIREFQKAKGLKFTGKIDSATWLALRRQKEIINSPPKTTPEPDLSLGGGKFLNLKEKDLKAEAKDKDQKKKTEVQDEIMSYRLKSKDRVKQIQTALRIAGFYKGEIDGRFGPKTKRAIKTFQKSKGLNPDGIVGQKTWEELNKYLKD